LEPSDEWSLDFISVKNEEKQSGSERLADAVGRADGKSTGRPAMKKIVYSLPLFAWL